MLKEGDKLGKGSHKHKYQKLGPINRLYALSVTLPIKWKEKVYANKFIKIKIFQWEIFKRKCAKIWKIMLNNIKYW